MNYLMGWIYNFLNFKIIYILFQMISSNALKFNVKWELAYSICIILLLPLTFTYTWFYTISSSHALSVISNVHDLILLILF